MHGNETVNFGEGLDLGSRRGVRIDSQPSHGDGFARATSNLYRSPRLPRRTSTDGPQKTAARWTWLQYSVIGLSVVGVVSTGIAVVLNALGG